MLQNPEHISQVFPFLFASEIILLDWQALEQKKDTKLPRSVYNCARVTLVYSC